jgi:hypothetical protein
MLQLSLLLLTSLFTQSELPGQTQSAAIPALTIAIDQPIYTGQPLWVRAIAGPLWNIRYPFRGTVEDIGCNRLEVKRNGVLLKPHPISSAGSSDGIACGSAAPAGSPENRLPLHVLYPLDVAGVYSVRWTEVADGPYSPNPKPRAQSDWLTFEVLQAKPEQHESWIRNLLAHPPEDDGHLAGDFLPSLLVAEPDPRALNTFVKYLYAGNLMVSRIAASNLDRFPQTEVLRAVAKSLEQHGPSETLAYFATYHKGWTREDQRKIVHASIPYLRPPVSTSVPSLQGASYASTQTSAAITLLRFIFYVPNGAWPVDPELAAESDSQILLASEAIITNGNVSDLRELALYLGSMQPSPRAHEVLLQIAGRSDGAAEQARTCLTWHPQSADLPYLASILIASGDADARGTDRSSLPYSMVRGYGDKAFPLLERAVAISPYMWVRTQSAKELALHNRPIGFQFLLDAIEANQPYKVEMIRWIKDNFPSEVPYGANERQIALFLRKHLGP